MLSIRKIGVIGRTYRHLNRYRQILTILFKYGFGDLLEMLKIDQYIEVGLQLISKRREIRFERLTRPQGLRMAFEELGRFFTCAAGKSGSVSPACWPDILWPGL